MPVRAKTATKKKRVLLSREERRRQIVGVTIGLLAEYGLHGTTVSRISAAAGISRGALYYHFANREALLEAAMDAMDEVASAWIAKPSGTDVPSRLLAMGEAHSQWALSSSNTFIRPFHQLIAGNRQDSLTQLILTRTRHYFRFMAECAEEGRREGSLAEDSDPDEVAWALLLHAWGEDVAHLMGLDEYITGGMSRRILSRLLATYSAALPGDGDSRGCREGTDS